MTKYHLTRKGEPGVCQAKPGGCPLGEQEDHYSSPDEARAAFEAANNPLTRVTVKSSERATIKQTSDNSDMVASMGSWEAPEEALAALSTTETPKGARLSVVKRSYTTRTFATTEEEEVAASLPITPVPASELICPDRVGNLTVSTRPGGRIAARGGVEPMIETMVYDDEGNEVMTLQTQDAMESRRNHEEGIAFALKRATVNEDQSGNRFAQTEELLKELQQDNGYTDAEILTCLADLNRYGVEDKDFANWLSTGQSSQEEIKATLDLNVEYFALQPQPWAEKDLTHPRQVAHRVGPYMVSTRPVASVGAKTGEVQSLVETMVWDSRDEYNLPIFEDATHMNDQDPNKQHYEALAYAQGQVRKLGSN